MAAALWARHTPHISGGLGYLYMVHFVSAIPNAGEYHEFKGLTTRAVRMQDVVAENGRGVVKVPTGPGSGIEIDPDFIKKHTVVKGSAVGQGSSCGMRARLSIPFADRRCCADVAGAGSTPDSR